MQMLGSTVPNVNVNITHKTAGIIEDYAERYGTNIDDTVTMLIHIADTIFQEEANGNKIEARSKYQVNTYSFTKSFKQWAKTRRMDS
jgi:hypothetical protein